MPAALKIPKLLTDLRDYIASTGGEGWDDAGKTPKFASDGALNLSRLFLAGSEAGAGAAFPAQVVFEQYDWDFPIILRGPDAPFSPGEEVILELPHASGKIITDNSPEYTAHSDEISGKEDAITAGTTGQYWRGDKSWNTLNATAVGLANVENAAASGLYVPLARTVNGHALSANVTVTAADLSLVIGTHVQAYSVNLTTFAGIAPSGNVQSLLGAADYAAMRSQLSLGTLATQSGTFSGTHSGTSSGTNTGDQSSVSGNAGTATALATPRTINGVSFDGTANISVTTTVKQIVFAHKTDTATSTSTTFVSSGLTATITPTSATSKILILVMGNVSWLNATPINLKVTRGSTDIVVGDTAGNRVAAQICNFYGINGSGSNLIAIHVVDAPATTSATTYQLEWAQTSGAGGAAMYLNRSLTDTNNSSFARGISSIVLIEYTP